MRCYFDRTNGHPPGQLSLRRWPSSEEWGRSTSSSPSSCFQTSPQEKEAVQTATVTGYLAGRGRVNLPHWALRKKSVLKALIATGNQERSRLLAGRIVHWRQPTLLAPQAFVTRLYFSFLLRSVVKENTKLLYSFASDVHNSFLRTMKRTMRHLWPFVAAGD